MSRRTHMMHDLEQDIRDHIEIETRDNIARGMSVEEARYAALRKFGNVTRIQEDTRDVWSFVWLEQLLQDIRFGLRMLRKSPAFTAVAILTLALGIGANTAIFSLIDAVMLRSLPVENPSQLVVLKWGARNAPKVRGYATSGDCITSLSLGGSNPSGCSFSEPMFREIASANISSGVTAFSNSGPLDLTGNGPASVIGGQFASGDFFRTLGVKAAAGRLFEPSDDLPTATPVVVLDFGYWQSAFGGSRDVIGRTIELNGAPFSIIGVAEQRFNGITPGSDYDVWIPLADAPRVSNPGHWRNRQDDVTFWWLTVVARLKPDVPRQTAQTALTQIFRNEMLHGQVPMFQAGAGMPGAPPPNLPLGGVAVHVQGTSGGAAPPRIAGKTSLAGPPALLPPTMKPAQIPPQNAAPNQPSTLSAPDDDPTITLVSAQTGLIGSRMEYADPLYVLMVAVGIILLIACANVAGLMLVRSAARHREIGVRMALGARRTRIVRQLLTESVTLSVLGGAFGILFAYWGAHAILSFVSSNQTRPLGFAMGVDVRMLAFTAIISIVTGILFGVAPAFRGTRVDLTPALKDGFGVAPGIVRDRGRWFSAGNALVVAQVALAIVVLVGAGLLVRTLQNLEHIDVGFDSHNLINFSLGPQQAGYKDAQLDGFFRDLQGRLAATPGVKSASYSLAPLLSGGFFIAQFHWPGMPEDRPSQSDMLPVGPDFFTTMQIPFLVGRNFSASDYALAARNGGATPTSAPTPVIVNQSFVAKFIGNENPIGKQFGESAGNQYVPASPGYEIVGVVRDAKYSTLRQDIGPTMYEPQNVANALMVSFEVRTAADPRASLSAIRQAVAQLNPNLPLFNVTTESEQIDRLLFQERLVARLSVFFGILALLLACIGLYGLLSYEVARRTREIGIRVALGAHQGDVLRLVIGQGIALAAVGAAIGVGAALGVTRFLSSLLYNVKAADPLTFIAAALLLAAVAALACYIPAQRAARVDPIVALRYE